MKALKTILVLAAFLSAAVPTALQAVAIPPELIEKGSRQVPQSIYGFIILIFAIGVVVGICVQERLNQHVK